MARHEGHKQKKEKKYYHDICAWIICSHDDIFYNRVAPMITHGPILLIVTVKKVEKSGIGSQHKIPRPPPVQHKSNPTAQPGTRISK
jgi:hypothetical protein